MEPGTRVVVSGICGRMGSMVAKRIEASPDLSLVGAVEAEDHESIGKRLCKAWGEGQCEIRVQKTLDGFAAEDFDVLVDFSVPAQAAVCAEKARETGCGLVIGTTGLTALQIAAVEEASRSCPVVVAPNASLGVNVLFGLARRAVRILGDGFDVEIVEAHHRGKMDAPSGTALKLTEIVAEVRGTDHESSIRAGRFGGDAARRPGEIGVHSLRAGAIVGRHELHLVSNLEELVLSHAAFSREAFAEGAERAIRFVHGREPGLYDMMDVLGFSTEGPAAGGGSGKR